MDWRDIDSFRFCSNSAANNSGPADTVDCVANGGTGNNWGSFSNPSAAALDTNFANLNIKAGDSYTIKIYADDGWKTVNGQADKTPIATYTNILRALPFSAATLAGTGVTTDLYARVSASTKTPAEIASAIRTKTAISTDNTWSAPGTMPDGRLTQLNDTYVFESGNANANGTAVPSSRQILFSYPGAQATSAKFTFPAPATALVLPTFAQIGLEYTNRNDNNVLSTYYWQ